MQLRQIVNAFASHDVVALGEGPHGNQQGHDFRLSLLRDPRFAATVNDVLVEFGNGRYQALMDRFVNGADIARDELRHVWQDTTTSNAGWERPIYEEFFRVVRSLNFADGRLQRTSMPATSSAAKWC